jgi:hypothetical protein
MTCCIELKKLAPRMIRKVGVVKTSLFTNISRVYSVKMEKQKA